MSICPLCSGNTVKTIYEVNNIPVFQNKVYPTEGQARNATTGDLVLVQCLDCGFIFNEKFDDGLMDYDDQYQNEQAYSRYFQTYLKEIVELLISKGFSPGKIVEIGCGKGYFLSQLQQKGLDVIGFDPSYEGDNPRVVKDYFRSTNKPRNVDAIILRHTLEHIQQPLAFLRSIAESNNFRGKIFLEVPCFDWIRRKKAFWDVYYEHCNYFTIDTLQSMFSRSDRGRLFEGQYLYLIADLKDLETTATAKVQPSISAGALFAREIERYREFIASNKDLIVWGAGAKGVTFVNLMDEARVFIRGLIDINPKKRGKYVAKTGHKIFGVEVLSHDGLKSVLVMNENYFNEVAETAASYDVTLHALGKL